MIKGMFSKDNNPSRQRFILLNIIMLALLLASAGGAWMIVRSAHEDADRGAKIVAQIRQDGIAAHWSGKTAIQWHLVRQEGKAVGWRVTVRVPNSQRGFDGLDVQYAETFIWERWSLNSDATEGTYFAGIEADDRSFFGMLRRAIKRNTEITLKDGIVVVLQHTSDGTIRSESEAPGNYLPEGTVELAFFLAAREGKNVQFKIVSNGMPPDGDKIRFVKLNFKDAAREGDGWRISGANTTFFFNEQGLLIRKTYGRKEHVAVPQQKVAAAFPNAPIDLQRLLDATKLNVRVNR